LETGPLYYAKWVALKEKYGSASVEKMDEYLIGVAAAKC
jgi:hypothetical protein